MNIETVEFLRVVAMFVMVLFAVENWDTYN
jgi:hypothetical protein